MEPKDLKKKLGNRFKDLTETLYKFEEILKELERDFFRVCIFGSARIQRADKLYEVVENLAHLLSSAGIDVVTGGGPGLMEAANKGAQRGKKENNSKSRSIGLPITLPFESEPNPHLDIKSHHQKFSSRLDEFMRISHAIVVTQGGIGTCLELFFSWQLIQVGHIPERPIILMGKEAWQGLIDWMEKEILSRQLVSQKDFDCIHLVDTPQEAFAIIQSEYEKFKLEMIASSNSGG